MASTVKVPLLGQQNKGTVIGVTIGGVTLTVFLIYRKQKKAAQQAAGVASAQAASSYGYGAQASAAYGYGNGYYGYGSAGGFPEGYYGYGTPLPPTNPLPVAAGTNAQWAQAAINQLSQDEYDRGAVAAALGAYLLGQPVTPNQQGIIQAAIGVEGYPPDPGANGYPPAIRVQGTPGGGGGGGQNDHDADDRPGPNPPPGRVTVPHVVGEQARIGLARLKAVGLKTKTSPLRNPRKEYTITATRPAGGTSVSPGTLVIVNVRVVQASAPLVPSGHVPPGTGLEM